MGSNLGKFYSCCWTRHNKVNHSKLDMSILLLGPENVGKTEIGNILAKTERTRYEPTNGVQCFLLNLPKYSVIITEIGGNSEMQKLWQHYYTKTMGLIFCYDMSASIQNMRKSFQLLNKVTSHPFIQGKPVLLVGTKSDMISDRVQLYDIENTFSLEALAHRYYLNLKSTCFNPHSVNNLWDGMEWLICHIGSNQDRLKRRISNDVMINRLNTKTGSSVKNFKISFRRPKTAPAKINLECNNASEVGAGNRERVRKKFLRNQTTDEPRLPQESVQT